MDAPQWNGPDDRQDECTLEWRTCECPACRDYRDNDRYLNGDEQAEAPDYAAIQDEARPLK